MVIFVLKKRIICLLTNCLVGILSVDILSVRHFVLRHLVCSTFCLFDNLSVWHYVCRHFVCRHSVLQPIFRGQGGGPKDILPSNWRIDINASKFPSICEGRGGGTWPPWGAKPRGFCSGKTNSEFSHKYLINSSASLQSTTESLRSWGCSNFESLRSSASWGPKMVTLKHPKKKTALGVRRPRMRRFSESPHCRARRHSALLFWPVRRCANSISPMQKY